MRVSRSLLNWRVLFKYRLYAGISLAGLGIAVAACWFIADFVGHSFSYDTFHPNHERIYRITMEIITSGNSDHYATTGTPPGVVMRENYPGIEAYAKLASHASTMVKANETQFSEKGIFSANPETLDVFAFDFLAGGKTSGISQPKSIILSRELALKYFNRIEILNEEIEINHMTYVINGVFENWPENSHLDVKGLIFEERGGNSFEPQDWFNLDQYHYILLEPGMGQRDLDDRLALLVADYLTPVFEEHQIEIDVKFHSQALNDVYFGGGLIDDFPKGNKRYVKALSAVGVLILLIAGFNYVNLSLTQSTRRRKEIAVKRILGLGIKHLWFQSALESSVMTVLVALISAILVSLFHNLYFYGTGFYAVNPSNWMLFVVILAVIFVFGLLGNGYSFGSLSFSNRLVNQEERPIAFFKKVLIGFQFVMASVILIATWTMYEQLDFIKRKDLGFSKDQVAIVGLPEDGVSPQKLLSFRERIKIQASVNNASLIGGGALPGEENGKEIFQVSVGGGLSERIYNIYRIDENYFDLLGMELVAGRNFQGDRESDKREALVINETLAKSLGWQDPIGKTIWYREDPYQVIGLVRNFHNKSLHHVIEPIVFIHAHEDFSNLIIKVKAADTGVIERIWMEFFEGWPFVSTYFDEFITGLYAKEDNLFSLLGFFSLVSLTLCGMGLFAVFSLHVHQRNKEMGIRKVMGASSFHIIVAITGSYFALTIRSFIFAAPLAWYVMQKWLQEFSYKIQMDPLTFIFSALLLLLGCCLTLLYHVIKVLNVNPIEVLSSD